VDEERIEKRVLESNVIGKRSVAKTRGSWVNPVDTTRRVIENELTGKENLWTGKFGGVI
jgi:hypothetical protein